MAVIRETLTLEDKLTNVMTQCIQVAERMAGALDDIRYSTMNVETATASTAVEMQNLSARMSQTTTQGNSMLTTVRNLAGAFLGMQSVQWLVGTSDQLTQINARLQMMTGSAKAAAEANDQIYQAAMRARGSYTDMADLVSQLGTLAPEAFTDIGEIIAFAEQLQKQMALSGTSTQAAQAAMLQLTQGLSSGTLRGEELNSVLEQTPMIAQSIAKYMGVTTGEMRELASEGAITADVVKNAMFEAAEKTDDKFAQMPMTWAQVWTMFQNAAIQALNPVLSGISWLANNLELVGPIVLGLGAAFAIFMAAANWVSMTTAATKALAGAQKMLGTAMQQAWFVPLLVITLVLTAIYAVTAAVNHFTGTSVSATGIIAGAFLTAFSVIGNILIFVMNLFSDVGNFIGNVFRDPIGAVKALFFDLASTVLGLVSNMAHGIEDLVNAIPGVEVNITGGIDNLYQKAQDAAQKAKDESGWVEYFKHQDYFDLSKAFQTGYDWGANLFSGDGEGSIFPTSTPYDELNSTLSGIGGDVKGIRRSVDMSDEDIKSLVDAAERRYVNNVNLTAQTPVITVNGANTGRTAADRQAIANAIRDVLLEEASSGAARTTARPVTA